MAKQVLSNATLCALLFVGLATKEASGQGLLFGGEGIQLSGRPNGGYSYYPHSTCWGGGDGGWGGHSN